jgi:hypothetical protein
MFNETQKLKLEKSQGEEKKELRDPVNDSGIDLPDDNPIKTMVKAFGSLKRRDGVSVITDELLEYMRDSSRERRESIHRVAEEWNTSDVRDDRQGYYTAYEKVISGAIGSGNQNAQILIERNDVDQWGRQMYVNSMFQGLSDFMHEELRTKIRELGANELDQFRTELAEFRNDCKKLKDGKIDKADFVQDTNKMMKTQGNLVVAASQFKDRWVMLPEESDKYCREINKLLPEAATEWTKKHLR